ncbi:unnamed protein product [Euphydryas editha]|uniref:Uncharacterized protein n=1 Tax=Euphydryas editha TaxID=104508 RepID=A0AAU9U4T9_EUPED|nr:unnamed protein product [Euphydryas editha]
MKIAFTLVAILLATAVAAEDVKCYVCNDCESGYENTETQCVAPNPGDGISAGGIDGGNAGGGGNNGTSGGGNGGSSDGGGHGDTTRGDEVGGNLGEGDDGGTSRGIEDSGSYEVGEDGVTSGGSKGGSTLGGGGDSGTSGEGDDGGTSVMSGDEGISGRGSDDSTSGKGRDGNTSGNSGEGGTLRGGEVGGTSEGVRVGGTSGSENNGVSERNTDNSGGSRGSSTSGVKVDGGTSGGSGDIGLSGGAGGGDTSGGGDNSITSGGSKNGDTSGWGRNSGRSGSGNSRNSVGDENNSNSGGDGDGDTSGGGGEIGTSGGKNDGSSGMDRNSDSTMTSNGLQYITSPTRLRVVRETNTKEEPRCVVTSYQENGKSKTKRGCSFEPDDNQNRCKTLIGGSYTGTLSRCYVCEGNLCNSGARSAITFIPLFIKQNHVQEKELTLSEDVDTKNHNENISSDRKTAGNLQRPRALSTAAASANTQQMNFRECYTCTNCPKVLPNTTSKICPFTLDLTKQGCVVYAEQYKHMEKPWYIRGCASERGSCADIRKAHADLTDIVSLLFCTECDGNKCNTNGASHSVSDFTIEFFAMVVTPIFAKYMLS